jgi:hypothetical protein
VSLPALVLARSRGRIGSVRKYQGPVGPFIAVGALEWMYFGPWLTEWWLAVVGRWLMTQPM